MSKMLLGLLGVLVSTNEPAAVSNLVQKTTGVSIEIVDTKDPVERELRAIMQKDDQAREEIDKWIRDAQAFEKEGVGSPQNTLTLKVEQRLDEISKAYEDFVDKHPKHAKARIAYGSFLNERGDEFGAKVQWEKALELDPKNPSIYNNLANYYGHRSPVKKSFEYYAKAIELSPKEPVYYQNFATTVYLFRKDAMEYYGISETEVFDKALDLYRQAMKLAPDDFILATDYAQSYYGTKPPRWAEGLEAWKAVLPLARDEMEREGIVVHLARCKLNLGQFDEARKDLNSITNQSYAGIKDRLHRRIEELEKEKGGKAADEKTPDEVEALKR